MLYNFDDLSFSVLSISTFKHNKGVFNVKPRNYSAFSFRTKGEAKFSVDGRSFLSSSGDVLFIPAGKPYEVEYSGGDSIVVHLTDCNYLEAENMPINNSGYIGEKFKNMLKYWENEHSINKAKADIYNLFYQINEDQSSNMDTALLKSIQYMELSFTDPDLQISHICKRVGLSESTLHRRFTAYYNLSPKDYLLNLRLNMATELLLKGELSVKEIAFKSGFNDEKYFSRFISKKLGKPPSLIHKEAKSF